MKKFGISTPGFIIITAVLFLIFCALTFAPKMIDRYVASKSKTTLKLTQVSKAPKNIEKTAKKSESVVSKKKIDLEETVLCSEIKGYRTLSPKAGKVEGSSVAKYICAYEALKPIEIRKINGYKVYVAFVPTEDGAKYLTVSRVAGEDQIFLSFRTFGKKYSWVDGKEKESRIQTMLAERVDTKETFIHFQSKASESAYVYINRDLFFQVFDSLYAKDERKKNTVAKEAMRFFGKLMREHPYEFARMIDKMPRTFGEDKILGHNQFITCDIPPPGVAPNSVSKPYGPGGDPRVPANPPLRPSYHY